MTRALCLVVVACTTAPPVFVRHVEIVDERLVVEKCPLGASRHHPACTTATFPLPIPTEAPTTGPPGSSR
jgi:hypothetical protein